MVVVWLGVVLLATLLAGIGSGTSAPTAAMSAADLRITLNNLLTEHVALAASATRAALSGQSARFQAAAAALDANSNDLIKVMGMVYGADAERVFGPLWKKHIGMVVDYTTALATGDAAKRDKAVADLTAYTREFGAFINAATKSLPTEAVQQLVLDHILTLKAVIDAQKANVAGREFAALRRAYGHMPMIAEPLADAIARQFPQRFAGSASGAAADLRATLNTLLSEHVYLAARATGAALDRNNTAFRAAATALDANSNDLIKVMGMVYGADAERAFGPLWKKHIGMVVDYTTALATGDAAKRDKAVADLTAYTREFGAFINAATKSLPTEAVQQLVLDHILTLKAVIDAQKANVAGREFAALRRAYGHMPMIAEPLADAIARQFPQRFAGSASGAAADLRATLNTLLSEHVYLAARATGAALDRNNTAFRAAATALDANSNDLIKVMGMVYGADAERAFGPLWKKHIGMVVDYTTALATGDAAKRDKAVADLTAYTREFGAFINAATKSLPTEAVQQLVLDHILTLKAVIDAQKAGNQPAVYSGLRRALGHMAMLADPLADAIVKQFPDRFR
jgi:dsRNA-specific ribonuclease